ncbi:hypothetical protein Stsp01_55520 [Streptomyces sp. NBRC 13847]|nr:hypothetical protein Stsp01_55520 [Streptomyces sp. NBRC 13847]
MCGIRDGVAWRPFPDGPGCGGRRPLRGRAAETEPQRLGECQDSPVQAAGGEVSRPVPWAVPYTHRRGGAQ